MNNRISEVAIIILNYNNYEDTKECVDSVLLFQKDFLRIIVVDNASTDDSGESIRNTFENSIEYIELDKNYGYAIGNNAGIRYAYDRGYSYICVLNNDTVMRSDFIECCIRELENNKQCGFVAPKLLNYTDGRIQSTGGDINLWFGNVFSRFKKGETITNIGKQSYEIQSNIRCDYVGGACMVFRRELLDDIGLIPENYFLFFEETEWCLRALRKGYSNVCLGNCELLHKGSASIDKVNGLHEYMIMRNMVAFEKRNCKNVFQFCVFLLLLYVKTFLGGVFIDRNRMRWFSFYKDGITGSIKSEYSFAIMREAERL